MKISELNKERLIIRKTDPVRATVLNLLVDVALSGNQNQLLSLKCEAS